MILADFTSVTGHGLLLPAWLCWSRLRSATYEECCAETPSNLVAPRERTSSGHSRGQHLLLGDGVAWRKRVCEGGRRSTRSSRLEVRPGADLGQEALFAHTASQPFCLAFRP